MINTTHYFIPAFFLFLGTGYFSDEPLHLLEPSEVTPSKILRVESIEVDSVQYDVVKAMIQVESCGNDSAYNAIEEAVGCLQIRPIMLREVNRILRKQGDTLRFKLEDRWDREKSLEMFHIWREYHHPNSTDEVIARNWNGGPKGYEKESTIRYWRKVKGHISVK